MEFQHLYLLGRSATPPFYIPCPERDPEAIFDRLPKTTPSRPQNRDPKSLKPLSRAASTGSTKESAFEGIGRGDRSGIHTRLLSVFEAHRPELNGLGNGNQQVTHQHLLIKGQLP